MQESLLGSKKTGFPIESGMTEGQMKTPTVHGNMKNIGKCGKMLDKTNILVNNIKIMAWG